MRASLLLLAGCWTSSTKPQPVPDKPDATPRYDERITARPLDVYAGEGEIDEGARRITAPSAPWEVIVAGYFRDGPETTIALEVVVGGKRYVEQFAIEDGGDVHILRLHDITPGGAQEILIQTSSIADGGETRSLAVCGIGASKVPSCADTKWTEAHDVYQPSSFQIVTPPAGGVRISPKPGNAGKTRYIGFDFP